MNVIGPYSDGSYTVDGVFKDVDALTDYQKKWYAFYAQQTRKPKPKSRRHRSHTKRRGAPKKGTNYAAQVLQRKQNLAMAELVERVNDDDEITD